MPPGIKISDSLRDWKAQVPVPVYDADPELADLYWKAWECAHDHIKQIPGMPQSPYMDEAFCHTQIWIWDTCFMSLFCKYAPGVFPGVESLQNFYDVMYGGYRFPLVTVPENEPKWTGGIPGQQKRLQIQIADNPPLFAWAEYENALFTGDLEHLRTLLLRGQHLQKHYFWLEGLKERFQAEWVNVPTCWVAHGNGYSWEGGRNGMDNSPRGRAGERAEKERPGTSDLLWLDALAQQGMSADYIGRLFSLIGHVAEAAEWKERAERKAELLRTLYWDPEDRMFYDRSLSKGTFCKVPTIASFWPLAAGAATREQAEAMAEKLEDPDYFGGERPLTSLARKDPDFAGDGGKYWRGSVWIPTAYMTLSGLRRYGMHDLARKTASKLLRHLWKTYHDYEPHTIWECYSPSGDEPAKCADNVHFVRKNFCGWSALAPISILIEYLIGIYSVNAFERKVCWNPDCSLKGRTGIRNFRFGNITVDMICENGICTVSSDEPFILEINGVFFNIVKGSQSFHVFAK